MRHGADVYLPPTAKGARTHTFFNVYREMLLQICRDYSGLPDARTLTIDEIVFFYDGLRPELRAYSKPRAK